jgi:hypothetical protein
VKLSEVPDAGPAPDQKRMKLSQVPDSPEGGGSTLGALWQGLVHGTGDIIHGGAQLGARMQEPTAFSEPDQGLVKRVDTAAQQREQAYQSSPQTKAHPWASLIGRIGGDIATTAPLAMVPGGGATIPQRLGAGMATGMMGAAMQPATGGDFWKTKALQMGLGGGAGGIAAGAGAMLAPPLSAAAQALAQRGVRLTPGQMLSQPSQSAPGLTTGGIDRTLNAFPFLRAVVTGQTGRSIGDFNKAAINQALEPIGAVIPRGVQAGHKANEAMVDALDAAFDKVLPHVNLNLYSGESAFRTYQPQITAIAEGLGEDQSKHFLKFLNNKVMKSFGDAGVMDGEAFKRAQSALSNQARALKISSDAYQREEGEAFDQLGALLRDALVKQNPGAADQLRNLNSSYAMFVRLRDAADRNATSEGVFSPSDLLISSRSSASKHNDFMTGDALMQDLATAGQRVLSGGIPRPTGERFSIVNAIIGAAGAPAYKMLGGMQQMPGIGKAITASSPAAGVGAASAVRRKSEHDTEPPP